MILSEVAAEKRTRVQTLVSQLRVESLTDPATFTQLTEAIKDWYTHDAVFHARVHAMGRLVGTIKPTDTNEAMAWVLALTPFVDDLYRYDGIPDPDAVTGWAPGHSPRSVFGDDH